ncbi:hypothetical protein AAG747_14710 [Rapidithrix thailandica]|uniref:DUF4178 domain-containing protein n=1 Tax=Rapidithrix thailandica TaxID=413964 RepID=A0AAW9S6N9_9BACT
METLLIPEIHEHLPKPIRDQVRLLPKEVQLEVFRRFNSRKKTLGWAYLTHFLMGSSYAYQEKWIKQVLFWLTGLGFGIGWVINLVRMPSMIKGVNKKIARKILEEVCESFVYVKRYPQLTAIRKSLYNQSHDFQPANKLQPRPVQREIEDPLNVSLEHLSTGFILDYQTQTWSVVHESQFDLNQGLTERMFKLTSSLESVFILIRQDTGQQQIIDFSLTNIHALDPDLQVEIIKVGQPRNVLHYQEGIYYKEHYRKGHSYDITDKLPGKWTEVWEYLNGERSQIIRIEKYANQQFKTYIGKPVSSLAFSEILPSMK